MAIEKLNGRWWVHDLGSKNGTLLNDKPITGRVVLKPSDRIRTSSLTLVLDVEPDPLQGTVIFDPGKAQNERPAMHTVTLGQLVSEESTHEADPSTQWSDAITALVRAGRELVARRPMAELFENILKLSLEAVGASRGVLLALEEGELKVKSSRGDKFHISSAVRDRVMKERTSLLVGDVMSDEVLRARQSIVMQQVHSLMAVPLQTDDNVLGLIYVDSPHAWRQFMPSDLNLLTVMANVAAMRIERQRLEAAERSQQIMERELQQAAEIQQQFLPASPPRIEGLELAGYNCPCYGVGGDYYDFVTLPDGRILVTLGDVAGKGLPAALLMINLQARVQSLAELGGKPADTVTSLNRALEVTCPSNRFVTFFLSEIDPRTGRIAFCNAGHNPPFLVRAGGEVETLQGGGPVLGILPGLSYEGRDCTIEPGDMIVIYSDGVTEANNPAGEEFGEDRLEELLVRINDRPASEIVSAINTELEQFVAGAPPMDDITIVVARRTG